MAPLQTNQGERVAIYALGDRVPEIHPDAYVHPDATVIGNVVLGAGSTVWPSAVLRGDYGTITIGERTSIQDGTIIHATHDKATTVGRATIQEGALSFIARVGTNTAISPKGEPPRLMRTISK